MDKKEEKELEAKFKEMDIAPPGFFPTFKAGYKLGVKEAQVRVLWKLIERFQEQRLENDACEDREEWNDVVLSYNDVECSLYEVLEEIDPSRLTNQSK